VFVKGKSTFAPAFSAADFVTKVEDTHMMDHRKFAFYLFVLLGGFFLPNQQAFSQEEGLFLDVQVINLGALRKIEIAFESARLMQQSQPMGMAIEYEIREVNGGAVKADVIELALVEVEKVNTTFYYNFIIDQILVPEAVMTLKLVDKVSREQAVKNLTLRKNNEQVVFSLVNLSNPQLGVYAMLGDTLVFSGGEGPIYLIRFKDDFLPAAPPMGNAMAARGAEIAVDTTMVLDVGQKFTLQHEALYFAQSDTAGRAGIGFRVVDLDFPKYKKVEKIARSMIYISTDSEINAMITAKEKKAVLDNFWINAGGSVENAQRMIKNYYQRVAHANRLFTNYKEGWKTDKGIVYIVFGRPDEVLKVPNGEQWVYSSDPRRKFTFQFVRRENIFTGEHYELVRSPSYKRLWLSTVEMWRKGTI
jgi:GWxTD domain-containing protein